jgi:hypothetical protein
VLSAALALACLVALIVLLIKYTKNPKPIDGVDFFLEEELKKQAEAQKVQEAAVETTESAEPEAESEADNNV